MNILILGAGGREHAMAWKIAQSPLVNNLFIAPGNAGTATSGTNLNISAEDFEAIKKAVIQHNIDLVLPGPEAPLVAGVHDFFLNDPDLQYIPVIGPSKAGAALEGSKDFAKEFMQRYNIPTAAYKTFTPETIEEGKKYLETVMAPYVLKADGLAAGKGVLIIDNLGEAQLELEAMLKGKFGAASSKVVIEEFLSGTELSVFVLTDGDGYLLLPEAKDYKRIGEGDTGLNTGGMGAVSPVPFANRPFMQKIEKRIIRPTITGLQKDRIPYKGFIFFGLINVNGNPYVIEYNVRMGDPEAEVVLPRISSDFAELLRATAENRLRETSVTFDNRAVATVVLVSGGYPGSYEKGKPVTGLDKVDGSIVFHAGTTSKGDNIVTNGGRVIAVSSFGKSLKEALEQTYLNAETIHFEKKMFRKDIGFDL